MTARADKVRQTVERIAGICGLSAANVVVSAEAKTGCRLTRSGIDFIVNHELNEDIAGRKRYGVRGSLTLEETDAMVACFVAAHAVDFLLDDWQPHIDYGNGLSERAQRYLQASIDDMAALARMSARVPFATKHFEAYLSRMAAHVMSSEPLHLQLMRTVRLYVLEEGPQIVVAPAIVEELGTIANMLPLVADIRRCVFDESLSYTQRHAQAGRLLAAPLARMIKKDEEALSFYDLMHLYDSEQLYGASKDAVDDENVLRQEADSASRAQASLKTVDETNIDQLIADNGEQAADASATPNLSLPGVSAEAGSMAFREGDRHAYESSAACWHETIEEIAEVLVRIATPQEQLSVPRYRARLVHAGSRMHPGCIIPAQMQLDSGQERAIWQKAHRRSRPQSLQFQGLDLYLLLDVSISMTGDNAASAAAMAVCLIEGIDLAVDLASRDQRQGGVDLRTQLIAFGEGWAELTPLETRHEQSRKHLAFSQIKNPSSEQTLVTAALKHVREHALSEPFRDVLCLVVGDGLFADGLQARKCAMSMPESVHLAHINIGEFSGLPLTGNFETIQDPSLLPEKLRFVLAQQLEE